MERLGGQEYVPLKRMFHLKDTRVTRVEYDFTCYCRIPLYGIGQAPRIAHGGDQLTRAEAPVEHSR